MIKNLYNKIMKFLIGIGSDKYLHFIVGCLISLLCMNFIPLKALKIALSLSIPFVLDLVKETLIDASPNWKDLAWTMIGAIIPTIIMLF